MTAHFRTLVFMLMFGVFMSNNIMVPVHQLGHIQDKHERASVHELGHIHDHHEMASLHESSQTHDDQETSITNCEAFHAIHLRGWGRVWVGFSRRAMRDRTADSFYGR